MTPAVQRNSRKRESGFTLIEIMVVVAIIALIATLSIPAIREATHREALSQAMHDITEACSTARARAILGGTTAEVRISNVDRSIQVGDAPADTAPGIGGEFDFGPTPGAKPKPSKLPDFSAHISETLLINMLDVNLVEYKDEPEARIRFFPNGTSDEFTMIMDSPGGERRVISLEVVTGLIQAGVGK